MGKVESQPARKLTKSISKDSSTFNHAIDLPEKNGMPMPLFDYEQLLFDTLQSNKHVWIKKATEFMLRYMAWLCFRGKSSKKTDAVPSGFTENNALPPEDSGIVSPPGEQPPTPPGEEIAPPSGFTENNAAQPSGFRLSNNTGNAYCDSCYNDIYNGSGDLRDMVLAVQNRERAAVGVPPLVWSDKLAADVKPYAEHLLTTAELEHPNQEWGRHPPKLATRLRG